MLSKIITLLSEILECELSDLSPETEFKSLPGWDSLAHISLITALESDFGVLVLDKDFDSIARVVDLVKYIEDRN